MQRFIYGSILVSSLAEPHVRRLIIDGQFDNLSSHPHSVALMLCNAPTKFNPNYVCGIHCSGSLIAPNVVVSAAHCVRNPEPTYDDTALYVDFDRFYVLAGSTDYDVVDWSTKSRLVKVKQAVHAGIGTNIRFPMDGDVAVLELDECIEPIQDQIGYVKVATTLTEPANDNCQSITVSGFGQISNAPDIIRDDDGRRRTDQDVIQTHSVCRDAYVAGVYGWTKPNQGVVDQAVSETVIPEMFLCTGGSTLHSVCFGDSGGGYVVPLDNNGMQVVGVVSFGIGEFCTTSPDYSSRLSFRALWILDELQSKFSTCPSWGSSWEKSFASWPLPEISNLSDIYKSSRCPSKWQCLDGSKCIDKSLVCNNIADCDDGSDEDSTYCATSSGNSNRVAVLSGKSKARGDYLSHEFEDLLRTKSDWIKTSGDRLVRAFQDAQSGTPGVVISGIIPAAAKSMRPLPKAAKDAIGGRDNGWPTSYAGTPTGCEVALESYKTALFDAKAQDTRDDKWDGTRLSRACIDMDVCTGGLKFSQDFSDANSVCNSLKSFLNWNITAVDYASNFNDRFGAACQNPSPAGFDPREDSTTNTPKSVELTVTGILFAISVVVMVAF